MSGLRQAQSRSARRAEAWLAARGYFAETFQSSSINTTSVAISGTVYYMLVGLAAGDVVATMDVLANAGAAAPTLAKVGLYTRANALVASSADSSGTFGTSGPKPVAVSAAYTVPSDDAYWAAFLNVAGTGVSLARTMAGLVAAVGGPIGSGVGMAGVQTGQADLPSTATISFAGTPIEFWMGLA